MSAGGGDADFSTAAELSLSVNDRQLSSIRSQIENELADIPVGVDAAGVGGGGRMQPRDPSTGRFMSIEGVEQRVIEQTELQVELLDDIKDALEGRSGIGQGAGGGAGAAGAGGVGLIARLGIAGGGAAAGTAGLLAGAGVGIPALGLELLRQRQGVSRGPIPESQRPGIPEGAPGAGVPSGVQLQTPPDFPPTLQTPADFPPELVVPEGFPPELSVPGEFPPELQVPQAPRWAQDLIDVFGGPGGLQTEVSASIDRTVNARIDFLPDPQDIINDVLDEVEPEIQDAQSEIDDLRRQIENALGL